MNKAERPLRVMQSFGTPRPTSNPYIVMLRDALAAEPGVEPLPFSWGAAFRGGYDVFHLHWVNALTAAGSRPARAVRKLRMVALVASWRLRRVAIVRTVHNVDMREAGRIDRWLTRLVEGQAAVEIHLNPQTFAAREREGFMIPHGHYRDWYAKYPRSVRRAGQIGHVGLIRPYKGIVTLIESFKAAAGPTAEEAATEDLPSSLTVAGACNSDTLRAEISAAYDGDQRITLRLQHIDDAQLVSMITACTLVALPYSRLDNSGAALTALSLDRPILVPRNDSTDALAQEVGERWVIRYTGDLNAGALTDALSGAAALDANDAPDLNARDWTSAGAAHLRAYRRAFDAKRGQRSVS